MNPQAFNPITHKFDLLSEMKDMKVREAINYALSLKPSFPKKNDSNLSDVDLAKRLIVVENIIKIRKSINSIILEYIYFSLDFYNVVPIKSQKKVLDKVMYKKTYIDDYCNYYFSLKSLINSFNHKTQ